MQLSFGQVEQLLGHLHGVTTRRRTMLRSRLQHLQKEDLPPGVAIGRGVRFAYGIDETFMIVIALELAKARIPAGHAAKLVKANWPTLRLLVDEGLKEAQVDPADRGRLRSRWAVISPDGLSLLRRDEPGEEAETEVVSDTPGAVLAAWMQRLTKPPRTPLIVVDVVATIVEAADFIMVSLGVDLD